MRLLLLLPTFDFWVHIGFFIFIMGTFIIKLQSNLTWAGTLAVSFLLGILLFISYVSLRRFNSFTITVRRTLSTISVLLFISVYARILLLAVALSVEVSFNSFVPLIALGLLAYMLLFAPPLGLWAAKTGKFIRGYWWPFLSIWPLLYPLAISALSLSFCIELG